MLKKKNEIGISKLWVTLNPLNEGWYAKKSFFYRAVQSFERDN